MSQEKRKFGNDFLKAGEVFVIAEIGKNFIQTKEDKPEEYLRNAKELISLAAEAGVDAVKFQTHVVEDEQMDIEVVSPHFSGSDRYSWVKRNSDSTPLEFFRELKEYAESLGIIFFSTPMSRFAARKLQEIDVPLWKIGSGDVLDFNLLDFVAGTKKPVIISTGMVSHEELGEVVEYLKERDCNTAILYCVSEYPAPQEFFNLATIEFLKEKYPDAVIGFSDHSVGDNTLPLAAARAGARIIEKHFSSSRDHWGSDHKVSMLPEEMKELVRALRSREYEHVDLAPFYGEKEKEFPGATNQFRPYFNKALVFGRDVKEGEILTEDMVFAMRPLKHIDGLASKHFHQVLGKKTKRNAKKFDPIVEDSIE